MADKKTLEEVKYRKALGRTDILGIKRELFLQGYKPKDIDEAFAEVYKKELNKNERKAQSPQAGRINPSNLPLHPNPYAKIPSGKNPGPPQKKNKVVINNKMLIIIALAIIFVLTIFFVIKSMNKPENQEEEMNFQDSENGIEISNLALSVKEFTKEISEGDALPFSISIGNPDYQDSITLTIKIQVFDIKGNPYPGLSREESLTLTSETSEVDYSRSLDTGSLKEGNYKVKVSALYNDEEKRIIKYFAVSKNRSLAITSILQEQSCSLDSQCDDNNPCTSDQCSSNRCTFTNILQCCGNFICESDESPNTCGIDCKSTVTNSGSNSSDQDIIQQALSRAKANPSLSSDLCSSISTEYNKDVCYSQIALNASRSQFCSQIQDIKMRDNCYLNLVTKINPTCDYILDAIKKETCLASLEN